MTEDTYVAQVEYRGDKGQITLRSQSDPNYVAEVTLPPLAKVICYVKEASCIVEFVKAVPPATPLQSTTVSITREKEFVDIKISHGGNAETRVQVPGKWTSVLTTYGIEPPQWHVGFSKT